MALLHRTGRFGTRDPLDEIGRLGDEEASQGSKAISGTTSRTYRIDGPPTEKRDAADGTVGVASSAAVGCPVGASDGSSLDVAGSTPAFFGPPIERSPWSDASSSRTTRSRSSLNDFSSCSSRSSLLTP